MFVFLWLVCQNEQKELSWNRQNESNGNQRVSSIVRDETLYLTMLSAVTPTQ